MAPPNRPPVRRSAARPPARSDTVPEAPAVPEATAASRRRVARKAKEPEKKKSKAPLVVVLLLLVAVAGAGYWKMKPKPHQPIAVDPSIAQTEELKVAFQEGKNFVRQGKWVEAGAKFSEVIALRPDFSDGAVQTYLAAAQKEIPNQKHFDEATAALDRNEVGKAHRSLLSVSTDTQQLERRDQLQTRQTEVFKARILEAQGLVQSGGEAKMKKLKNLAEDLLVARPDDRDALEFKAIADRALRIRVVEKIELPKDDPGLKVQSIYASGDAGGALAAAAACANEANSCRMLEGKMSELNGLLKRLEALSGAELDAALRLDRQIAGGKSSSQSKPIAVRASAVFYKKASDAKTVGDWPAAMTNAFKAADADSSHNGAQAIIAQGKERARDLFLRCYQLRQTEPDQAVPLCNEVVGMLPSGDSQREKAERVLQSIRGK